MLRRPVRTISGSWATPGAEIPLRWVPYDRGWGTTFNRPEVQIVRIQLRQLAVAESPIIDKKRRPLRRLPRVREQRLRQAAHSPLLFVRHGRVFAYRPWAEF